MNVEIINESFENAVFILNCYLLIVFVFRFKYEANIRKFYYIIIFYLITVIIYLFLNKIAFTINNFILVFILLYNMFDESPNKKIFIVMFTMFFETFLRGFAVVGLKIFGVQGRFTAQIVVFIIIIIMSILLNKVLHIAISNYIDETLWYIYMNMLIAIFACILPLFVVSSYENSMNKNIFITIIFTTLLTICTAVFSTIFYLIRMKENNVYKKELMLREQLSEAEKKYFESIVDEYKHLRSFRHDINGHMNILFNLANAGKCDSIIDYLNNIKADMRTSKLQQCNNIYIAATINQFLHIIKEQAIEFEFTYAILEQIHMSSTELCSLFNNIMSNAVEATLKNQYMRKITLDIQKVHYSMMIELKNTVHANFDIVELKRGSTTKADKRIHGIGLTNIDNVINKYNGNVEYRLSNSTLIMNIVLLNIFN